MKPKNLNKPHLLIMAGIPGSGKSFFAEHFSETFKAPFISSDRLRKDLFSKPEYTKNEDIIIDRVEAYMLDETLKTGQTILYEGTTNTRADRQALVKKAVDFGYKPLIVWVQTEPLTAKKRSLKLIDNKAKLNQSQFDERSKKFVNPNQAEKYVVISGKHTFVSQLKIVLKHIVKTTTSDQPTIPINPVRPQVNRNILIR